MKIYRKIALHSAQALAILFIYYVTVHCSFSPREEFCGKLDSEPSSVLTSASDPNNGIFEDPGKIFIYHGFGCSKSDQSGGQKIIKIEQSIDVPRYTMATVFLNGWHFKYLHGDHNVAGIITLIRNIQFDNSKLSWQSVGLLSDDNFDDPYNFCYYYTVIAWNPTIDLWVDHKDGDCDSHNPAEVNYFFADNKGMTTALSSFATILQNSAFQSKQTVAIAPRGFGFKWDYDDDVADHNLLQIGYNMEHSERFNEYNKHYFKGFEGTTNSHNHFSLVGSGYASWETYAIFKDNSLRREYAFGELVSEFAGNDLGVIQPPFSILPVEDDSGFGCVSGSSGIRSEDYEIRDIPYEYAIPMLTGWELNYDCRSDHNVKEIGIRIDKWGYEKDPAATTGRLHYTLSSYMADKDGDPDFVYSHKITVLGLKPLSVGVKGRSVK